MRPLRHRVTFTTLGIHAQELRGSGPRILQTPLRRWIHDNV